MERLDVLYASDANYIDIMMTSIISLIKNSNIKFLNIHIISSGFNNNDYSKVRDIISRYPNVKVDFYPLEEYDIERYNIPSWHGLQVGNARLFFQDIIGNKVKDIDTLLYLDGDTLVKGDLNQLDKYTGNPISACKDNISPSMARKYGVDTYYNSGVLLINVNEWVRRHLQDKILDEVYNPSTELYLPDQNILNIALKDDIGELPINYNLMPLEYFFNEKERKRYFNPKLRQRTAAEVGEAIINPKIYHCCCLAGIKPWYKNSINPFNEEFLKYVYEVNPDFELYDSNKFRQIFDQHPELLKKLLLLRNYLPNDFNIIVTKLSILLQGNMKSRTK